MTTGGVGVGAHGEIALAQGPGDIAEQRFGRGLVTGMLLVQLALMADAQIVEAQRHGDLEIDEGHAQNGSENGLQLLAARLAGAKDAARPELVDEFADEMFDDDGMAGDLPARLDAHAGLRIGENLDALGIEAVEAGVGQHAPMGKVQIMQAIESALALEGAAGIAAGLDAVEMVADGNVDTVGKHGALGADCRAGGLVEPGKAQTVLQAARPLPSRLFLCLALIHSVPRSSEVHDVRDLRALVVLPAQNSACEGTDPCFFGPMKMTVRTAIPDRNRCNEAASCQGGGLDVTHSDVQDNVYG